MNILATQLIVAGIDANKVLQAIIAIFRLMSKYGGILLLLAALTQFIFAIRDDDGPKFEVAKKLLLIGLGCLAATMIIDPVVQGAELLINSFYESVGVG